MVSIDSPLVWLRVAGNQQVFGVVGYKNLVQPAPQLRDIVLVYWDAAWERQV